MLLVWLAVAWMAGLVAADWSDAPLWQIQTALGVGGGLAGLGWRWPRVRALGLIVCCAALAGWRFDLLRQPPEPHDIRLLAGREATLLGSISADPRRTGEGQQLTLAVEQVRAEGRSRAATGLVLVNLPPYPEYRYGQRLLLLGQLGEPGTAERPGEFDYRDYLARKNIFVLMQQPLARVLPDEAGNPALRALLAFRDRSKTILMRSLPEPQAAIGVGILLGLQSSIPDDVYDTFSVTGTSHLLVVSGWNFTIVAAMLAALALRARLGRGTTLALSLLALWAYAFFVGATGTVMRAAVMASLVVIARSGERETDAWRLLAMACWALTLHNPQTLWDLGFQLSALATASLFAFGKPVERWLERVPPLRWPALGWMKEALTATFAAQILALPIILFHFGNLSVIAPLANVLLVPVVPYAMLLGALALIGGLVWLPLGQALALAAWLPLAWISEGARLLAQVPGAAMQLPAFPLWQLLAYYAAAVAWGFWLNRDAGAEDEGKQGQSALAGAEV
ncbi:MAG TPA: ComEC/Rec2 family competence protein [Roseiflexaceae bacterium]|nr:ComEC/Rec2 family competence protein [Roseiflexaceae bacterium]